MNMLKVVLWAVFTTVASTVCGFYCSHLGCITAYTHTWIAIFVSGFVVYFCFPGVVQACCSTPPPARRVRVPGLSACTVHALHAVNHHTRDGHPPPFPPLPPIVSEQRPLHRD